MIKNIYIYIYIMSKIKKVPEYVKELVIRNEKIIQFYNENQNIDFETVNLLYIDLFNNLMLASTNSPLLVNKIVSKIESQNKDIGNIMSIITSSTETYKTEISTIKDMYSLTTNNIKCDIENIKNLVSNSNNLITNKLYENKDNYIRELTALLKSKESDSILTLEKQNNNIIDKMMVILNDILPKSLNKQSEEMLKLFKDDISKSINKIIEYDPNITIDKLTTTIENKYNNLAFNMEQHVLKYVNMSEDRLTTNLSQLKDISIKSNVIQEKICEDLTIYLNKNKSINSKGTQGENKLFNILNEEYLTGEIIDTSNLTGQGDIILKRCDKTPILFETKNYTGNVKREEVDKFIRDINNTKYHGIFISQNSGIVDKNNFQIDIHNDNILIYIHKCNYDISKINLAINTLDLLSEKIINLKNKNINISVEILRDINNDYQKFIIQKYSLLNTIKDNHKKILDMYSDLELPNLEKWLNNYYANNKKIIKTCPNCRKYSSEKNTSMARHMRFCKQPIKEELITSDVDESSCEIVKDINNSLEENEIVKDINNSLEENKVVKDTNNLINENNFLQKNKIVKDKTSVKNK